MKIEWIANINNYGDDCKFYEFQDLIYFPCNYRNNNHRNFISVYRFNKNGNFKNECFYYETYDLIERGQDWRIFIENNKIYLSCGRDRRIIKSSRFYKDQFGLLQKEFHQEEKSRFDLFFEITKKNYPNKTDGIHAS